jgi:hypothetical protein
MWGAGVAFAGEAVAPTAPAGLGLGDLVAAEGVEPAGPLVTPAEGLPAGLVAGLVLGLVAGGGFDRAACDVLLHAATAIDRRAAPSAPHITRTASVNHSAPPVRTQEGVGGRRGRGPGGGRAGAGGREALTPKSRCRLVI